MAFENPLGTNNLTLPASTGLVQYQAVSLNSAGLLIDPTTLPQVIGVLVSSGTTGSTVADRPQSVQVYGVAKVLQGSSGLVPGNQVAATTSGTVVLSSADNILGIVIEGSASTGVHGTTDDIQGVVSVLLLHMAKPTTAA